MGNDMSEVVTAPAGNGCGESSVEALSRAMRACRYPKADIVALSKRLREGELPPLPGPDDVAALKVEKNALALVFIPEVMTLAEELVALHPGCLFGLADGSLEPVAATAIRQVLGPDRLAARICCQVHASARNLFQYLAGAYMAAVAEAASRDPGMARVATLLHRYQDALSGYHAHTAVAATHFTPAGHLMAGVNTALFFILRALSAVVVLGERALRRPVSRGELAQAMAGITPLLLTIARCHLELLLELEGPLGKGGDLYLLELDDAAYAGALAAMFEVTAAADGLRLEVAPRIVAGLPTLGGDKPRTGCPALYAAASDNVNAIVALIRMTENCFAELWFA